MSAPRSIIRSCDINVTITLSALRACQCHQNIVQPAADSTWLIQAKTRPPSGEQLVMALHRYPCEAHLQPRVDGLGVQLPLHLDAHRRHALIVLVVLTVLLIG
jgi:hypothetical protein